MMMHLTNYAINKESMEFVFNRDPERDDVGHKRSLKAVLRSIDNRKHFLKEGETMVSSEEIWASIKDIILKTLITAQPSLAHAYRTAKPDDMENSLCFQILGFDIFLDKDSKPWLLEVNHTPSFTTDTPLDLRIKKNLIADTIRLLGLSVKRKMRY
jgi:tubulin polyglutamylase TTLL6/13